MKCHITTAQEKGSKLTLGEILRVNKIWLYVLSRYKISIERQKNIYADVCEMAGEIYEDPELWLRVDDYIFEKMGFKEAFERENYDEREQVSEQIHKEHHKKWRKY